MLIKQVDKKHIDVFWGKGWKNWARLEKQTKKLVKGYYIPNNIYKALLKK